LHLGLSGISGANLKQRETDDAKRAA